MEKWEEQLTRECELRNLAEKTKKHYITKFKLFANYHKGKDVAFLGLEDIKDFILHMQNTLSHRGRKYSPHSINATISTIRFYYLHVHQRDYSKVIGKQKTPKYAPLVLTQGEVKTLIDSVNLVFWKAVIMTLYTTGMRQSELRHLKVKDVDSNRMIIHIRNAKGKKDRQVPLTPSLLACLRTYWKLFRANNEKKSSYLFMPRKNSHNGRFDKPLSHTAVGYMLTKSAEFAGLKKKFILTA